MEPNSSGSRYREELRRATALVPLPGCVGTDTAPPGTGDNLPEWMRQPTRPLPTMGPGRVGNLTPAQQWRANGGRWSVPEQRGNGGGHRSAPEQRPGDGHHEERR